MAALSFPMRRRRSLVPSQCPSCRGGREINGVPCRDCSGERREARRQLLPGLLGSLATAAGTAVRWSMSLPGLLGAAGMSVAAGEIIGHVFGHGLTPWVALAVGAGFALRLDWRLS